MSTDLSLILAEVQALKASFEGIQDAFSTSNEKLTPLERAFANAIPSLPVKILFAGHCCIHSLVGSVVTIYCLNREVYEILEKPYQREALEKAAESVISKKATVEVFIGARGWDD
jgi:hypothetical protein